MPKNFKEHSFVQVSNKEPNIKKTLVNIKPKREENVDIVVMEEDVEDEEEEEDFLGGRRIEERRPAEVRLLFSLLWTLNQQVTFTAETNHGGGGGPKGPSWKE